jgi:hypothetical protein
VEYFATVVGVMAIRKSFTAVIAVVAANARISSIIRMIAFTRVVTSSVATAIATARNYYYSNYFHSLSSIFRTDLVAVRKSYPISLAGTA